MKRKLTKRVTSFFTVLVISMASSNAFALDAPVLTVTTSGLDVSLLWTPITGATDYSLHYAPHPYVGEHTIGEIDMGANTSFSAILWDGAAFYVAITATDGSLFGDSGYSNVETFQLIASEDEGEEPWDYETVTSAGQVWMDRNLGASQVATSFNDEAAYGDLYQWGRGTDGHEKRDSSTTSTVSSSDDPGHGSFITLSQSYGYDWRYPQNDNLWQGESGINNPCPAGFRLPTATELETELNSWSSNNYNGAFDSPLKLVAAGERYYNDGTINSAGSYGLYWSSTVEDGGDSRTLDFESGGANMNRDDGRASGCSARCFED